MRASDFCVGHLVGDVDTTLDDLLGHFLIGFVDGACLTGVDHHRAVVLPLVEVGLVEYLLLAVADVGCSCPAGFEAYALVPQVFGHHEHVFNLFGGIVERVEPRRLLVGCKLEEHVFYGVEPEESVGEIVVDRIVGAVADFSQHAVHRVLVERP